LAAALLAAASRVSAQALGAAPPRAGDHVRVRVTSPPDGPVGLQCEAPVAAVVADTLALARAGRCPAGAYVGRVEVWRGDRGSRAAHASVGLVGGAVLGGLAGRLIVGDGCRVAGCDGGTSVAIFTVLGGAAGALVGGVVGALLPAGPQWVPAGGARPVRVAGLAVRPALRVALGPRPR
jgi:hypothetical protein